MSIAGPAAASFWSQQRTTLSELLMRAGNQRAARLLSLAPAAELRETAPWDPVQVVLRVKLHRNASTQILKPGMIL